LASLIVSIHALPVPTQDFYVADFADVLNEDTTELINTVNSGYEKQPEQPQVVVLSSSYIWFLKQI